MKKLLIFIFFSMFSAFHCQIQNPVKFDFKINELKTNEYEAVLTAVLEKNWHIYSKDLPEDSGIPTEFLVKSPDIKLIGGITEVGQKHDEFSEAFSAQIIYYSDKVQFKQKFKLKNSEKSSFTNITAEITYQTCNDRICLAPNTLEFEQKISAKIIENQKITEEIPSPTLPKGKGADSTKSIASTENANTETAQSPKPKTENSLKIPTLAFEKPLINCGERQKISQSYLKILVLGFLSGFIALLTPCVFPMIPLTVSYFTKTKKEKGKRDALVYGFFILLIFTMLSLPFYIIEGISGNIFNAISTNVWLNLFFFMVFLFFAISFFGYFDIILPSSLANKSAKAEEAGGFIGLFFMALTLAIISFSCTGPILGTILGSVLSNTGINVPLVLTFALAGFGFSWALVFGVLAFFPQALHSLPKSGGWMNSLKVVLGFVELALALKFLSKADLVSKTFLLKRELFIGLWILCSVSLMLYLLGKIKFPYDDKNARISPIRYVFAILSFAFTIYLIQGLITSQHPKLQWLSGILPPLNVSYFQDESDGILGIKPEHDYFKAVEIAKLENKPVLIDFTGYGCENCRKMEEFVWSKPDILLILQNDVILVSVYVDDKEQLPENEQFSIDLSNGQKKKIRTVGDKWSMFQQVNFNNNSQPHYVLVTPDQKVINNPVSGYMSKEGFKKFLQCGIDFYKKNLE